MKKTFQTYIFQRYLGEDRMDALLEEYNSNRKSTGREKRVVGPVDRLVFSDYRRGMTFTQLAAKYQRSFYWINKAIQLAAAEINDQVSQNKVA